MKEFNKVIGYDDIKIELERIIDMMINKDKYEKLGAKTTRGLLLEGNPGVGKTLMAKCFIKASKRTAFTIRKDLPDGEFVKHIKNTFIKAKSQAPSIVFLDDMDKFANCDSRHKNAEEYVTIQACIDDCKDVEVFVLATSNQLDAIPDSLLREGRFDKEIWVYNPVGEDARLVVEHYLSQKKCSKNIDSAEIARLLDGRSCATLETVINEAAVYAGYANQSEITQDDLVRAFMRLIYGSPEKQNAKDSKYIKQTAYHEAGHAIVSEILENGSVNFVTVKPYRSSVKGFAGFNTNEDYFDDMCFMENRVISLLAGKAAIEIAFGVVDVGANSDIHRAFDIVERLVDNFCSYGFNNWEGNSHGDPTDLNNRRISIITHEMEKYYQKAKKILIDNRKYLDMVVDELLQKQVLLTSDLQRLKASC